MRLFIAIVPPQKIRDILSRAQLQAKVADSARIRWTPTENLHMTVKFLGEVPDAQIPPLCLALSSANLGDSFSLHLVGVTGIPQGRPHRVIAAGVEGDLDAAKRLADLVDHVCHTKGFPLESRTFMPHITIGRTHGRPLRLNGAHLDITDEQMFRNSAFSVQEIVLMSSTTRPTGPEYAHLASFPLRKKHDPLSQIQT